jgi:hypothetical protein
MGSLATRSVKGQGVALAVAAGSAPAGAPRLEAAARVATACGVSAASVLGSPRQ